MSARCRLRGGQAVFWPPLTSCQMEQLVTIHHQWLPEMQQRHSFYHPSSLAVTDGLAGTRLVFLSLMFSGFLCLCEAEALRL